MNWFKKKLQQLSEKLNADDAPASEYETGSMDEAKDKINAGTSMVSPKRTVLDNIEELKEITIGAISNSVGMLAYGNTVVSGLVFHSSYADNAVENLGLEALVKDTEFSKQVRRTLKSKGVKYKDDLKIEVIHGSELTGKVTRILDGIGVEVLTPTEMLRKIRARVVATEGVTWEPEYILEPDGKPRFIGRGKDPKIDNGPKIHNDIAFISVEEKDEEQYRINNYVSRSHAYIVFDKDLGAFTIYRSRFLNNPSHKIKIYNAGLNDFTAVSLNQATVPHVLRNGDSICLNDKVVLEFYIMD